MEFLILFQGVYVHLTGPGAGEALGIKKLIRRRVEAVDLVGA